LDRRRLAGRSRFGPVRHQDHGFGGHLAVDLGASGEAPEIAPALQQLDVEHELVAVAYRLLEARFFYADEIEDPQSLLFGRSLVSEHAAGLRERFYDQHSGHYGVAREVALKISLVHADVLDRDDGFSGHYL